MTNNHSLEKCSTIIERIINDGFLSMAIQFMENKDTKMIELTKNEYNERWIKKEEKNYFKIDENLIWNVTENKPYLYEETDEKYSMIKTKTFIKFFSENYCQNIEYKNVYKFVQWTRDEFKNAWFIDKIKQIIYFKFRQICGEGAVKRTYLGWNITNNKPVAIYQINISDNQIEQKRCLNEKRIAEIEKSDYLLTINFSLCSRETRKVYMIADFCRYNIRQMINDQYQWKIDDLKKFSRHILMGLKVLHDMNIIHRDVKPSNIIYDNISDIYKLIDFGIATKYSSGLQLNKIETLNPNPNQLSLVGTPGYISPEMYDSLYTLKKITYTKSVDIYSFGITLLEMYIKERAFKKDFENLPQIIQDDLLMKEMILNNILQNDTLYLKNLFIKLDEMIKNKKLETLRSEIQEKMSILHQLETCCDFDEKEMFLSELIDKNKTIFHCCKKIPDFLKDLDENTNIEYEFLYKMNALQKFAKRLDSFTIKSIDDLINDYQFYPLLYMISSYEYPISLNQIDDPILTDFIISCIHKNVNKRSSINDLLNHSWLQ